jgi:hypothetical protein
MIHCVILYVAGKGPEMVEEIRKTGSVSESTLSDMIETGREFVAFLE